MAGSVVWELARRKARTADHILTQTYPLVKDAKLLVVAMQHASDALEAGVETLLAYEYEQKRIPTPGRDFASRIAILRADAHRLGIPPAFLSFVAELQETMREHRDAPVEFVRKDSFVICDETYQMRTLNEQQLKGVVERVKAFIALVEEKTQ